MNEETPTIVEKQTSSFTLKKMAKGYGWELKIYDDDLESIKRKVKDLDTWAKENYGGVAE